MNNSNESFEKRFMHNLNRYKKYSTTELIEQARERKKIYGTLSLEEIIDAECLIIEKELEKNTQDSNAFKVYIKKIINLLQQRKTGKSKRILTIIQLSLNIRPVFLEEIESINEGDLDTALDELTTKRFILGR